MATNEMMLAKALRENAGLEQEGRGSGFYDL